MDSILEVSGVDQQFLSGFWLKPVQVLHQIQLQVPRQSIFGFLGANGAGKTTLIHLIIGLRRPTRGSIRVLGHEAHLPEAKSRIGYLPERPYFHEHLTGQSLLEYFGSLAGLKRSQIKDRIPIVLQAVGMSHARQIELKKYSKGMLQRIGIAQALLHDPEFLVLDEPMSGLDPLGRKEMRELLFQLAKDGRTIFFSSHVIPDVEAICDQVAVVQKGRLIHSGPTSKFLRNQTESIELGFAGNQLKFSELKSYVQNELFTEIPEGYRATVRGQEGIDQILPKLLEQGAKILWIQPERVSLESFFKTSP